MKKFTRMIIILLILALCTGCNSQGNKIDIDIADLSNSESYNMVRSILLEADKHVGKTIRMKGEFAHQEFDGVMYFVCITEHQTGHRNGIEFILKDAKFPDEYPTAGDTIIVTGTFMKYTENGEEYARLANATYEIVKEDD